jgi:hypothetical protein
VFTHWKGSGDRGPPDHGSVRLKAINLLQSGCINRATGLINAVGLFNEGKKDEEVNICIGNVQSGNGKPFQHPPLITSSRLMHQTVSMIKAMPPESSQAGMSKVE